MRTDSALIVMFAKFNNFKEALFATPKPFFMDANASINVYIVSYKMDNELVRVLITGLEKYDIRAYTQSDIVQESSSSKQVVPAYADASGIIFLVTSALIADTVFYENFAKAFALLSKSGKRIIIINFGENNPKPFTRPEAISLDWLDLSNPPLESVANIFKPQNITDNANAHYWLLKMNPNTWIISEFKKGNTTFCQTYYLDQKRPEYELYKDIRSGDQVLAYAAGEMREIVALFEVIKPVGPHTTQGEGFEMTIKDVFTRPVALAEFAHYLGSAMMRLNDNEKPTEILFGLSGESYQAILSMISTPVPRYINEFLPSYLTEGDHNNTADQLEFENDINSFASLIALQKVNPPLAIGLFGNWGSGKSFFMQKLAEKVSALTKIKEKEKEKDKEKENVESVVTEDKEPVKAVVIEDKDYVESVVQVTFNSWHYSDANLWASLITEIFDSLSKFAKIEKKEPEIIKLQKTLSALSLERDEADQDRQILQNKVNVLQTEQENKRKELADRSGIQLLKLFLSDSKIRNDLTELKNDDIEGALTDIHKVNKYIGELKDTGNKASFFFRTLYQLRGWRWVWVIGAAVVVAFGVPILKTLFPDLLKSFTGEVRGYAGLAAGLLTNIFTAIKPYHHTFNQAFKRLKSLQETMEVKSKNPDAVLAKGQQDLTELQNNLIDLDVKIEDTKTAIVDISSGRRLLKFIDERADNKQYSNALGVISWIRKDFVILDQLLREQHYANEDRKKELAQSNPQDVKLKIDRIVLYIDDLDRCNEEVVVKVLEAIHLLLAFPLFVVVVGVDPRWLNNALSEKYKNLFGADAKPMAAAAAGFGMPGAATSYDYLEKIFQIPFALKPIGKTGRDRLIEYLIRDELKKEEQTTQVNSGNTANPSKPEGKTVTDTNSITPTGTTIPAGGAETSPAVNSKPIKARLVFTEGELNYMRKVSPLFGQTPRTINRYVNIYRIIKAHGSLEISGQYSKDQFMPVMFLLAVIVGCAKDAETFITALRNASVSDTFISFIGQAIIPDNLRNKIEAVAEDINPMSVVTVRKNIDLVSRFSFRTLLKSEAFG